MSVRLTHPNRSESGRLVTNRNLHGPADTERSVTDCNDAPKPLDLGVWFVYIRIMNKGGTQMTENFYCAMYPNLGKLSDGALDHARTIVLNRVRLDKDHACFKGGYSKGDYIEAMAMIVLEEDYRWENGGKQAFQELVNREFGDRAIEVK